MSVWILFGSYLIHTPGLRLIGTLLLVIVMLAMVETLYRQAGTQKWQFKPLVIAIGICLLLDFYLLAEAALLSKINQQTWQARGFIHLFMLPFLVVAVKRIKSWGINVYVSRDIVLQKFSGSCCWVYLCLLAVVGYYLSYIGGNWTTLLQVVFVVIGTAVLGALVFSDGLRRKGRVFIEKHFFANTFDYREKWIELTRELKKIEFASENTARVCLDAWCHAIGYSHGALLKLNHEQCSVLATKGQLEVGSVERQALSLVVSELQNKHWLLDFSDRTDPIVAQLKAQLTDVPVTFSIVIPILKNNQLWGFCLLEGMVNEKLRLNWELRDYLNAVTEQISSYLFMDEASKTLSENAQFVAFSRMSAFVVHDLKNVKAQIDMLLKNAKKHRNNPEFVDDAFATIEAMQSRLQNMLAQLTNKQVGQEHIKKTAIGPLLRTLIDERCSGCSPTPLLTLKTDCSITIDAERLQ
ncbi:MAG: XrtA/PEP-CTERM system histidine kinase PrsK [Rheinheimera sp.]|nr:XrtA/PEP-CTERM system histidine kinase PrsK [Rheinheimera sp.]